MVNSTVAFVSIDGGDALDAVEFSAKESVSNVPNYLISLPLITEKTRIVPREARQGLLPGHLHRSGDSAEKFRRHCYRGRTRCRRDQRDFSGECCKAYDSPFSRYFGLLRSFCDLSEQVEPRHFGRHSTVEWPWTCQTRKNNRKTGKTRICRAIQRVRFGVYHAPACRRRSNLSLC